MEIIHEPPTPTSFTPLALHHSQTPDSFFSGPPVLHHHSPSASLSLHASDLAAAPALSALANDALRNVNGTAAAAAAVNGEAAEEADEEIEIAGVDVWVTSERFILFSPSLSTGLSIPYPAISLHAVQRPAEGKPASLFLQLLTEAHTFDDHDPNSTISITIVPAAATAAAAARTEESLEEEVGREAPEPESQAQQLYAALSACANLHPDPMSGSDGDGDEEGEGGGGRPAIVFEGDQDVGGVYPLSNGDSGGLGLPPPMPGSGGWITAENVGEFFDEEGNWRGEGGLGQEVGVNGDGGGLGEGAGVVRTREEDDDGEEVDGEGDGMEETKWRRTE